MSTPMEEFAREFWRKRLIGWAEWGNFGIAIIEATKDHYGVRFYLDEDAEAAIINRAREKLKEKACDG